MAKLNPAPQSATPQAKVRTLQILRRETPGQLRRREQLNFWTLEEGLDTIRAISDVLDYTQDLCQSRHALSMTIIAAGLAEALKVTHRQMAAEIEAR